MSILRSECGVGIGDGRSGGMIYPPWHKVEQRRSARLARLRRLVRAGLTPRDKDELHELAKQAAIWGGVRSGRVLVRNSRFLARRLRAQGATETRLARSMIRTKKSSSNADLFREEMPMQSKEKNSVENHWRDERAIGEKT
jgi:hypothetical protein